ncbi:MAG: RNA methyltransferase [Planctomycetes bacterium]|nr:RNA methyltransferase [Planctomycetota bacterium]
MTKACRTKDRAKGGLRPETVWLNPHVPRIRDEENAKSSARRVHAPRVVLARPQLGENIGFVVRLLSNHDFDDLVLVSPRPGFEVGAEKTASMCRGLLDEANVLSSLDEALAGRDVVVGFTARHGRERPVDRVERLHEIVAGANAPALVFGNEESGLDGSEAAQCTHLVTIERDGLSSLNLSHAVAIALHEATRHDERRIDRPANAPSLTTLEERQRLEERARAILERFEFRLDDPHIDGAFARLVHARGIERRDARTLLRFVRHFEWWLDERVREQRVQEQREPEQRDRG